MYKKWSGLYVKQVCWTPWILAILHNLWLCCSTCLLQLRLAEPFWLIILSFAFYSFLPPADVAIFIGSWLIPWCYRIDFCPFWRGFYFSSGTIPLLQFTGLLLSQFFADWFPMFPFLSFLQLIFYCRKLILPAFSPKLNLFSDPRLCQFFKYRTLVLTFNFCCVAWNLQSQRKTSLFSLLPGMYAHQNM